MQIATSLGRINQILPRLSPIISSKFLVESYCRKWGEMRLYYGKDCCDYILIGNNLFYCSGVVLQRETVEFSNPTLTSGLKFTVAFNLAVVWMLVFVSLSKGKSSFGLEFLLCIN